MAVYEAVGEQLIRTWTCPTTGRDLVALDALLDLAAQDGHHDVVGVLHGLLRHGADVVLMGVPNHPKVITKEVVAVRMPRGWGHAVTPPR